MSLDNLALVTDALTRRSSSYDRTGGNVDSVHCVLPGDTVTLLDTAGPGKVTHIWLTIGEFACHPTVFRDLVIRMYWEDALTPSVEVPLGDFFGLGHALPPMFYERRKYTVVSTPVTVGVNERAMNCYWPMPFHRSARIEVYNNGLHTLRQIYYHVDYELGEQPPESALFHAEFRQEKHLTGQVIGDNYLNLSGEDNYVLMETEGRGQYVGCFLYVDTSPGGWWGEGDDMIYIDHDVMPTITGTGSEDYFNNAWCYHHPFTFPYYGCPLLEKRADGGTYTSLYRFHGPDPVRFREHIKVTIERWWNPDQTNGFCSVAFWYQQQPVTSRVPLPCGEVNHPVFHELPREDHRKPVLPGVDLLALEVPLRASGLAVKPLFFVVQEWLEDGSLLIPSDGKPVVLPIPVRVDGLYRIEVKPVYALIEGEVTIGLEGLAPIVVQREIFRRENDGPLIVIGSVHSKSQVIDLTVTGPGNVPLHRVICRRLD